MQRAPLVHIVDDDESLRQALGSLFRSVGTATRTYKSARDFLQAERVDCISCLVLDIRMPGISGLDFQRQLIDMGIRIPVVFLTGHGDIPMSVRGMKAGAVDFLTKPFRDQDMLDAVAAALEKDRARRAQDQDALDLQARFASLSGRERQVMTLVTSGMMNKQVAAELNVSEITVKIHRGSAMRKMSARTLADFVRMASALGLPPGGKDLPK
jgi:FixJ family two-component response regulator